MFALYGCVPRIGKDSASIRRLIGPHGDDCEVVYLSAKGTEVRRRAVKTEAGATVETTVRIPGGQARTGKSAVEFLSVHSPAPHMVDMRLLQAMAPKDRRTALAALVPGGTVDAILRMQDAIGEALDKTSTPEQIIEALQKQATALEARRRDQEKLFQSLLTAADPEAEALAGRLPEMQAERKRLSETIAEQKASLRQSENASHAFQEARQRIESLIRDLAAAKAKAAEIEGVAKAVQVCKARTQDLECAYPETPEGEMRELADSVGRLAGKADALKEFAVRLKQADQMECPTCFGQVTADEDTIGRLRGLWQAATAEKTEKESRLGALRAQADAAKQAAFANARALREAEAELRKAEFDLTECQRAIESVPKLEAEIERLRGLSVPEAPMDMGIGLSKAIERVADLDAKIQKGQKAEAARDALAMARPGDLAEPIALAKEAAAKAAKAYADWQSEILSEMAQGIGPHIQAMGIAADAAVRVEGKDIIFGLQKGGAWIPIEEVSGAEWLALCLAMQAELVADEGRACVFELSEGGLILDKILEWGSRQKFAPLAVATWATPKTQAAEHFTAVEVS